MNIYVGNMAFSTTEQDLNSAFAAYGKVGSVRLATDRDTGRPRGFAFVEMNNDSEAQAAISGLNGRSLDGREIVVNEAKPREERSGSGSGGGNGGFKRQGGFRR